MVNTIGNILRLTTFGESHGPAIGGVLDGCPAGTVIDEQEIALQLQRRMTAQSSFSSSRKETDQVEFISGIEKGVALGTPICFMVRNTGHQPKDYENIKEVFRPSHADYSWFAKFGAGSGSGGGRTSARVLLPAVVAGCIARDILRSTQVSVLAWVSSIGTVQISDMLLDITPEMVHNNELNCPDPLAAKEMLRLLTTLKKAGDTTGGTIICRISGVPAGLGEPVFGKLHASLAHAMMGINSVKAFEYGSGFEASRMKGSEYNDALYVKKGTVHTRSNHDGGINGGISNGEDILFRIAFKPIPSVHLEQKTLDTRLKPVSVNISGRHDTCVVPRSVTLVESLANLVIADQFLMQKIRNFK